jgi:ATP-binding protein involved in chromosome partitioning
MYSIMSTPETFSSPLEKAVWDALSQVNDPELHQSLTSLGMVQNMKLCGGNVEFDLVLTTIACPLKDSIRASAAEAVQKVPGVENVHVNVSGKTLSAMIAARQPIPGIKNIIAVSSGKGGVGKTTTSVNIACAMMKRGASVGILDADIYGPNVPIMMGLRGGKPGATEDNKIIPPENHNIKVMSMAFLIKEEQPVVWRGPMLDKIIRQFLTDTQWGELDYLIIDLPPGTGDAQLTIVQAVPVVGAVIVTTPQDVALHDSRKGLSMFASQGIPILGIIENMSYYHCPSCGHHDNIFGHGGGENAAKELNVPFLGAVPLNATLRAEADQGVPIVIAEPESEQAQIFGDIAHQVVAQICELGVRSKVPVAV